MRNGVQGVAGSNPAVPTGDKVYSLRALDALGEFSCFSGSNTLLQYVGRENSIRVGERQEVKIREADEIFEEPGDLSRNSKPGTKAANVTFRLPDGFTHRSQFRAIPQA